MSRFKILPILLLSGYLLFFSGCSALSQGVRSHQEGDLESAKAAYQLTLKDNPRDTTALNNLGLVYLQQKQFQLAVTQFEQALQLEQNHLLAKANLKQAYNWLATNSLDESLKDQAKNWLSHAGFQIPTQSTTIQGSQLSPEQIQAMIDQRITKVAQGGPTAQPSTGNLVHPAPITGQKFALVIGISKYNEAMGYKPLAYAAEDARRIYTYLTTKGGFRPEQTHLLLNEEATANNIRRELRQFLRNSANSPDDIVFIYYSGHGDLLDQKEAYIVPYGVRKRDLPAEGVSLQDFHQDVDRLKSQKVAMFIDSCHSGSILQGVNSKGALQEKRNISDNFLNIATEGRLIMTSSSENEVSLELKNVGGLFTHYMLKGLQGEADFDQDKAITVAELYEYVRRNVERDARDQTGTSQSVQRNGKLEGVIAEVGSK